MDNSLGEGGGGSPREPGDALTRAAPPASERPITRQLWWTPRSSSSPRQMRLERWRPRLVVRRVRVGTCAGQILRDDVVIERGQFLSGNRNPGFILAEQRNSPIAAHRED